VSWEALEGTYALATFTPPMGRHRADSAGGTHMIFTGERSSRQFSNFDGGAVQDLLAWNLLHLGYSRRGTPNYRVTGEALRFYRWLMQNRDQQSIRSSITFVVSPRLLTSPQLIGEALTTCARLSSCSGAGARRSRLCRRLAITSVRH
jgi:hypothetical protein